MRYLRTKPEEVEVNELQRKAFVQAYSVLETYLQGNSMKNGLYFAKNIDYFSTQYGVGVRICFDLCFIEHLSQRFRGLLAHVV